MQDCNKYIHVHVHLHIVCTYRLWASYMYIYHNIVCITILQYYSYFISLSLSTGRTAHTPSHSCQLVKGLDKMRERELVDLLSQYESEEKYNCVPTTLNWIEVRNTTVYRETSVKISVIRTPLW